MRCCHEEHAVTLGPDQNGRHFADVDFKYIFLDENFWICSEISMKYFPRGPIYNNSASVQVMVPCLTGDKPLPKPMLTKMFDAICEHHYATMSYWINLQHFLLYMEFTLNDGTLNIDSESVYHFMICIVLDNAK